MSAHDAIRAREDARKPKKPAKAKKAAPKVDTTNFDASAPWTPDTSNEVVE
jgi:hypothetical protein